MKNFRSLALSIIAIGFWTLPSLAQSIPDSSTANDPLFDANTKLDGSTVVSANVRPDSTTMPRARSIALSPQVLARPSSGAARSIAMSNSALDQFSRMAMVNNGVLSADTLELAEKVGLLPMMEKLERLRNDSKQNPTDSQILQLLLAKQQYMEAILATSFEVRCTINNVEAEIDRANDLYAVLAERRDRATLLNTYANLISGGVTGIVSGGLSIGQVNYLVPSTIDTVEGVVQTAISVLALNQQKGQHQLERGTPSILARIINPSEDTPKSFASSVWTYLNMVPGDSSRGETRVQKLVRSWREPDYKHHRLLHYSSEDRASIAAGTHPKPPRRTTVNLLEDRMAMLTDFQTLIAGMEFNLLELVQFGQGLRTLNH